MSFLKMPTYCQKTTLQTVYISQDTSSRNITQRKHDIGHTYPIVFSNLNHMMQTAEHNDAHGQASRVLKRCTRCSVTSSNDAHGQASRVLKRCTWSSVTCPQTMHIVKRHLSSNDAHGEASRVLSMRNGMRHVIFKCAA